MAAAETAAQREAVPPPPCTPVDQLPKVGGQAGGVQWCGCCAALCSPALSSRACLARVPHARSGLPRHPAWRQVIEVLHTMRARLEALNGGDVPRI